MSNIYEDSGALTQSIHIINMLQLRTSTHLHNSCDWQCLKKSVTNFQKHLNIYGIETQCLLVLCKKKWVVNIFTLSLCVVH